MFLLLCQRLDKFADVSGEQVHEQVRFTVVQSEDFGWILGSANRIDRADSHKHEQTFLGDLVFIEHVKELEHELAHARIVLVHELLHALAVALDVWRGHELIKVFLELMAHDFSEALVVELCKITDKSLLAQSAIGCNLVKVLRKLLVFEIQPERMLP